MSKKENYHNSLLEMDMRLLLVFIHVTWASVLIHCHVLVFGIFMYGTQYIPF